MLERPAAILTNVPKAYFHDGGAPVMKEAAFRRFYESMGYDNESCFYHFISGVPVHPVQHVYICFGGFVQYKAIVVEFLKNQPISLPNFDHPFPRNWMITTGPVVKAPPGMVQRGFRGFRYTKHLF